MNIQKCAIVGCGAVGATAAYTLLGSGLFNELVLIDINQKKAATPQSALSNLY